MSGFLKLEGCEELPLRDFIVSSLRVRRLKGSEHQKMRGKLAEDPTVNILSTLSEFGTLSGVINPLESFRMQVEAGGTQESL